MPLCRIENFIDLIQKGDDFKRELVLKKYKSKIYYWATLYCKRSLDWANDDELSIAMEAFNEAIDSFKSCKGSNFLAYARVVIRNKLIDYFKKEQKHRCLSMEVEVEGEEFTPAEYNLAQENYQKELERVDRVEEIKLFHEKLKEYGLSFQELVTVAPKHRDTRNNLFRIARTLLENKDLLEKLTRTKRLPIKELMVETSVSRKVLEKGRKYIIAIVIVYLDDQFNYLKDFIAQRGD